MQTDTLIIGSGIAGATTALRLAADRQRQIILLTRAEDPIELELGVRSRWDCRARR